MTEADEIKFSEPFDLNDELIEEFLDYCEEAYRPSASLSFNIKISHLVREDREEVLDEFIEYLTAKINPEDDIIL